MLRTLRRGSTVVDVGANIGWFALLARTLVGSEGRVIAIEPDPAGFDLLSESVRLNGFDNVHLLRKVATDKKGTETLNLSRVPGQHSLTRKLGGLTLQVEADTLDNIATSLGLQQVDLLKLDVEGGERRVLQGAKGLMANSRIRQMYLEWNPDAWTERELLDSLFSKFGVYEVHERLPMLRLKRIVSPSDLPDEERNLYLRLR